MLSCTYLAYIMQHLHRNVINANMQEYVYMNLISHFPQKSPLKPHIPIPHSLFPATLRLLYAAHLDVR